MSISRFLPQKSRFLGASHVFTGFLALAAMPTAHADLTVTNFRISRYSVSFDISGTVPAGVALGLATLATATGIGGVVVGAGLLIGLALACSGSGMANAGRILHHFKHRLHRKQTHVVFVGYQAEGTTGRRIVDGAQWVRIHGHDVRVAARRTGMT